MNAFPMFVLPLNSLAIIKIIIVEMTKPITKMMAGLSISNDAIMIYIIMKKINRCIEFLIVVSTLLWLLLSGLLGNTILNP